MRSQATEECVAEEQAGLAKREAHKWKLPWTPAYTPADKLAKSDKVCFCLSWLLVQLRVRSSAVSNKNNRASTAFVVTYSFLRLCRPAANSS